MSEAGGIPLEQLRCLAERAGLRLSEVELTDLKPMYDHYAREVQALHELELGMEDLAVMFPANWGTQL